MSTKWTEKDIRATGLITDLGKSQKQLIGGRMFERAYIDSPHGEIMPPSKGKRANKYHNTKVTYDGIPFDSKKEGNRYLELKIMQQAGLISELKLQPEFEFSVNRVVVCKYIADFAYVEGNKRIVEDVKSEHTRTLPVYRIKNKLMKACYGIDIKEV